MFSSVRIPLCAVCLFLPVLLVAGCGGENQSPGDGGTGSSRDGSTPFIISDAGSDVPYWQWWYPDCGVPAGDTCNNPSCAPTAFVTSSTGACELGAQSERGCVPKDIGTIGHTSYTSVAFSQLISTLVQPYTLNGLDQCGAQGMDFQSNACCPWLDGGTDAGKP